MATNESWMYDFDESLFKSDEQQAQERADAEAQEYALYERVTVINQPGTIVDIMNTGGKLSYLVESEWTGNREWYSKRLLTKAEQLAPAQEIAIEQTPHEVGDVIEHHGHTYRVISVEYVTAQEAADAEDANDVTLAPGYHGKAVLVQ